MKVWEHKPAEQGFNNNGERLAYQTEKTLTELGDKVPEGEKENIESQVAALRKALEDEDAAEIKQLSDALQNAFNALSQQRNAQEQDGASSAGGPGDFPNYGGDGAAPNGSAPTSEEEGDVVEGEFTDA